MTDTPGREDLKAERAIRTVSNENHGRSRRIIDPDLNPVVGFDSLLTVSISSRKSATKSSLPLRLEAFLL